MDGEMGSMTGELAGWLAEWGEWMCGRPAFKHRPHTNYLCTNAYNRARMVDEGWLGWMKGGWDGTTCEKCTARCVLYN